MKKYFFIISVLFSVSVSAQIKISAMPTHSTSPDSAYLPIVVNGVNKKVQAFRINRSRIDSASNAIQQLAGQIEELGEVGIIPASTIKTLTQLRTGSINDTTVYQTADGGLWLIDPDDDSSADNTGTIVVNVNTRIKRLFSGPIYASWFGLVNDGVTDNTEAINDAAIAQAARGGGDVNIGPGAVKATGQINLPNGVYLVGEGSGATTLDMSEADVSDAFIYASGSLTALPAINTDITAGDASVVFASAPSLSTGDVYVIEDTTTSSFSTARTYYHSGEFLKVDAVASNTVSNAALAYGSYTATKMKAWKANMITVGVRRMSVIFKPATLIPGISVSLGEACNFDDLILSNNQHTHLQLDRCFNTIINDVHAFDNQVANGFNYGITLINSQRIIISDCILETTRHGLTCGGGDEDGSVPNRAITVTNSFIASLGSQPGLDFHGIIEDYTVSSSQLPNGVSLGGDGGFLTGNKIKNDNGTGVGITFSEQLGLDFRINDNELKAIVTTASLVDCRPSSITVRENGVFEFSRNTVNSGSFASPTYPSAGTYLVFFAPASTAGTENYSFVAKGNTFITTNTTAGSYYGILVQPHASKGVRRIEMVDNTGFGCGLYARSNFEILTLVENHIYDALEHGIRVTELTGQTFTNQIIRAKDNGIARAKATGLYIYQDTDGDTYSTIYCRDNVLPNNARSSSGYSAWITGAKDVYFERNIVGADSTALASQLGTYRLDVITNLLDNQSTNVGSGYNALTFTYTSVTKTEMT